VPALNKKKPIDFNTVGEEDFNGGLRSGSNPEGDEELKI
jgi:hypothetical protein